MSSAGVRKATVPLEVQEPSRALLRVPAQAIFGTKAEVLGRLRRRLRYSSVLDLIAFTVEEWLADAEGVCRRIARRFPGVRLAIRSSARAEDGAERSMAGAFLSCLDVDASDIQTLKSVIRRVIDSYDGDPRDQVLVQPMVADVIMSGVVMTRDLTDGAPYHVINYDDESGRTDSITGGTGVNKTVFVHREVDPEHVASRRIAAVLRMAREVEAVCGGVPVDVEFCIRRTGEVHLLQARRIAASAGWRVGIGERAGRALREIEAQVAGCARPAPGLVGRRTLLGVMPDWNPAEIIGTTPGRLAVSLYRDLVTRDVWREARAAMGYRPLPDVELMATLGGRPYIDVRASFNSLLPAGLGDRTATIVVDAWLDRLEANPELHDKVEFEVAQTCVDATFEEDARRRYGDAIPARARSRLRAGLRELTARALDPGPAGHLARAERAIARLAERQRGRDPWLVTAPGPADHLFLARALLDECRREGTLPFAGLARHAFVAESLLRSLVRRGALRPERLEALKRSIRTVSGEFTATLQAVAAGRHAPESFLRRFGHLRPGTYDIRSLRYADRPELLRDYAPVGEAAHPEPFEPSPAERRDIGLLLAEAGLGDVSAEDLIAYAGRAIAGREYGKLVFTRNLSDALELIARWGEPLRLSRDDLAFLGLAEILAAREPAGAQPARLAELVREGRESNVLARAVKLGHLVRDAADLYVVPQQRSTPNFVGDRHLQARVAAVDATTSARTSLAGRIVCIENADPGFDWIFGRGIAGLVTQYGGANSHMAIRCAEFGLPAAIGCGAQLYERVLAAGGADLNCLDKTLRPLHEH